MFKKFDPKSDVASSTKVKSSVQRAIRSKLVEQMPLLSEPSAERPEPVTTTNADGESSTSQAEAPTVLDAIWPRKEDLTLVKCREHVSILSLGGTPLFFQHFDGPYYPTLHLLHQFQIDRGAIKFILAGSNISLTSAGGSLPEAPGLPAERAVAVFAQGKELPCAIGLLKMSTEEIKKINKGHGIETVAYLNDDLWKLQTPGARGLA